jgi:hypothetical protein
MVGFAEGGPSGSGFALDAHRLDESEPVIPWRVGLHRSPPPLHRPVSILWRQAETVNHHQSLRGEFSTGEIGNFQPALTSGKNQERISPK